MKKFTTLFLLLVSLSVLPLLWFFGRKGLVIVQSCESGGKTWKTTTIYRGDYVRKDVADVTTTVFNMASGATVIMNHPGRTYTKGTLSQLAARTRLSMGWGSGGPPELEDTGRTEKVNGYDAEVYTGDSPSAKFTCWIAKDYPGSAGINERLAKFHELEKAGKLFPDVSRFAGMVVKSEVALANGTTTTVTLESANIEAVSDAEFRPPPGYTEAPPVVSTATP